MAAKFPHIKFLRDRDSEPARERSHRLDNLLREKLGLPLIEPRAKPMTATVAKGPDPSGRMMNHQPRAGMCQLKGRRS
jgi:hypothetical protein